MNKIVLNKNKIFLTMLLLFGSGMIGTAFAQTEDCPSSDPNSWPIVNTVYAYSNTVSGMETYLIDTVNKPGSAVKELCVYPSPGFTGNTSNLTVLYPGFVVDRPDSQAYFGFMATGSTSPIPLNGATSIPIGKALYSSVPISEIFVIHLLDSQECGSGGCWRRPSLSPLQTSQLVADPKGPYSGNEGASILFDGSASTPGGNIVSYNWNFGDGNIGIGVNPSHMYSKNGTYSVTLTVNDSSGNSNSNSTTAIIADVAPVASFVADPSTGNASLTVNFSDTSIAYDKIVSWKWDFNYNNAGSTIQNPTYTYSVPGTYKPSLQICDSDGICSTTTNTITVTSGPIGDTQPPSQPLCPVAIVLGPTSIYLSWQASTDNVGVVGYKIYRGTDSQNLYYYKTVQSINYTDIALNTGTTYYYSIVAIDAAGNPSIGSDTVYGTPRDINPPTLTVPRDMTVEATSPSGAVVNFSVSATDDYDPNPVVNCNPSSGSTFHIGYTTVTCTATDATGNVGSAIFSIRVVDTTPPTAPVLAANAVSSSEIDLSWTASYDAVGVANYLIYRSKDGNNFSLISSVKGTTFNNAGLLAQTQYYYYVKAYDAAGNPSNPSNTANAITLAAVNSTPGPTETPGPGPSPGPSPTDTVPPISGNQDNPPVVTVPTNMLVEATAPNGAIVTFNASAYDSEDGSEQVTCYPSSGSRFPIGITMVTCTAQDSVGNIGSAVFSISVVDTTPPTLPSSLSAMAIDSSTIGLGWNPSTDAVGVTGYYIYRSKDGINFAIIARVYGTTFTNAGLLPNTTYYYYVRAYDGANNPSGPSNIASAQTLQYSPGTPGPTTTPTPTSPQGNPCSSSPNTPVGQNVQVSLSPINVNFDAVVECGQTTAVAYYYDGWSPLPSNYSSVNYYDVGTSATYSNTITIQIYYSSADIPEGVDPNTLRLFHYENGNWADITTALDTQNGIITGTVSSLSPFSIAGLTTSSGGSGSGGGSGGGGSNITGDLGMNLDRAGPSASVLSIILLAILLVSISLFKLKRR